MESRFYKNVKAFSLLEILICILILSILSLSIIKPQLSEVISIRAASVHLQTLQKEINNISYMAFKQKQKVDKNAILTLINNAQTNNNFFTFVVRNNIITLTINKARARLNIRENANGSFSITCNPSQELCRKLYHRKQPK